MKPSIRDASSYSLHSSSSVEADSRFCCCYLFLAHRYFQDEKFVSYLSYLQYWKKPEYVKFIVYPHCLYFLDQLQVIPRSPSRCRSPQPTSSPPSQQERQLT